MHVGGGVLVDVDGQRGDVLEAVLRRDRERLACAGAGLPLDEVVDGDLGARGGGERGVRPLARDERAAGGAYRCGDLAIPPRFARWGVAVEAAELLLAAEDAAVVTLIKRRSYLTPMSTAQGPEKLAATNEAK